MIYATIRIEVHDPHSQPAPRCWKAIADAGEGLARLAMQPPDSLQHEARGMTREGDTWVVEIRASPF